jgi:hypothetical protein
MNLGGAQRIPCREFKTLNPGAITIGTIQNHSAPTDIDNLKTGIAVITSTVSSYVDFGLR